MDMLIVKRFHTHNKFHLLDYRCIKSTITRDFSISPISVHLSFIYTNTYM